MEVLHAFLRSENISLLVRVMESGGKIIQLFIPGCECPPQGGKAILGMISFLKHRRTGKEVTAEDGGED